MSLMHEWVLLSIVFDWKSGRLTFSFDTYQAGVVALVAEGVVDLHVPQTKPWGPSVHVNEVRQPPAGPRKRRKLEIESRHTNRLRAGMPRAAGQFHGNSFVLALPGGRTGAEDST